MVHACVFSRYVVGRSRHGDEPFPLLFFRATLQILLGEWWVTSMLPG